MSMVSIVYAVNSSRFSRHNSTKACEESLFNLFDLSSFYVAMHLCISPNARPSVKRNNMRSNQYKR